MNTASLDLLMECLSEALETTAFISLMPAPEATTIDSALIVSIPLGDTCQLHLAAPRDFGATIAANILALDPGSPEADERAQDALQEIVNVVAGLYLSRAPWLEGVIPEMGLPKTRFITDAGAIHDWLQSVGATVVLAEERPVAIAVEGGL